MMRHCAELPLVAGQTLAAFPPDWFYAGVAEQRRVLVADERYAVL